MKKKLCRILVALLLFCFTLAACTTQPTEPDPEVADVTTEAPDEVQEVDEAEEEPTTMVEEEATTEESDESMDADESEEMVESYYVERTTKEKLENAMSAGPAAIAQNATILDYTEEWPGNWPDEVAPELVEIQAGDNGWTCIVDIPSTPGNDPMCLNETYLDVIFARYNLVDSPSDGIGFGYMLQGGGPIGSPPHMMIFTPESNDSVNTYGTEPGPFPWIMFPETSHQHLMVLVTPPSDKVDASEDKIANAMSAGPAPISQNATILDYPEEWPGNWPDEVAPELMEIREGDNGWTCIVDIPNTPGNDPMCLNETYLEALFARYTLVDSPSAGIGFGYMLQGGGPVGSPPHMMVFTPESNASVNTYGTEPGPFPWIMFPETSHQHLMVMTAPSSVEMAAPADSEAMPDDNLIEAITNAPIVSDGLLTGAFPDFVIHFDIDMDPSVPGRRLMAGDQIRITMPDAFTVNGDEPEAGDAFAPEFLNEYSWAALLQGWPQVPIFSSFPPGNLDDVRYTISLEGTHTMVITADVDLNESLPFPGPGIKQIHLLFAHLVNPEPGTYEVKIESETGAGGAVEHGVGMMEIVAEETPTINFTSVFNGQGRPNAIYQETTINSTTPIPFHMLVWGEGGEPLENVGLMGSLQQAPFNARNKTPISIVDLESEISTPIGEGVIEAPEGASGHTLFTNFSDLSSEITAPISGVPTGHLIGNFIAGDTPGLYTITFSLEGGNSIQAFVNVKPDDLSAPLSRTWPGAAYDQTSETLYLAGGRSYWCFPTECVVYRDIWAFDTEAGTWEQKLDLQEELSAIEFDRAAFDSESGELFVIGATDFSAIASIIYDDGSNTYRRSSSETRPSDWTESAMIYHPASDNIVLFGGIDVSFDRQNNETWIYDTTADAWEELDLETAPPKRWRPAFAYDSDADRLLVYGGDSWTEGVYSDLWEFDIVNQVWSEIVTDEVPMLEPQATGAYDAESKKFILFGRSLEGVQETWAFDYESKTWTNMMPFGGPSANHPGDAVYSSGLDRVLSFGGAKSWPDSPATSDEFWAYDYDHNAWELFDGEAWQVVEAPAEDS